MRNEVANSDLIKSACFGNVKIVCILLTTILAICIGFSTVKIQKMSRENCSQGCALIKTWALI